MGLYKFVAMEKLTGKISGNKKAALCKYFAILYSR